MYVASQQLNALDNFQWALHSTQLVDRIEIGTLWRPFQYLYFVVSKPLFDNVCHVLGIIVLLKDPFATKLQLSGWGFKIVL